MRSHILSSASLQKALGNQGTGTNKKKDAKRRSARKSDSSAAVKIESTSQWYTTEIPVVTSPTSSFPSTPVFELRQEVNRLMVILSNE